MATQLLEGHFTFEKDSEGNVSGSIKDGKLKMKSGGKDLISLTKINGFFEMSSEGIYGALGVVAKFGDKIPGLKITPVDDTKGIAVTVQMNTVNEKVSGDFKLGEAIELSLIHI